MESGFRALTVALALGLPGDYSLPLGSRRGINQHGELAVVEQAQRAEQPTAGRDRFSFKVREPCAQANGAEGVRESVTDLLRHSLPAKGGNEGCLSGRLVRPRRASTFFLIDAGNVLTPELGAIGPILASEDLDRIANRILSPEPLMQRIPSSFRGNWA